MGIIRAEAGAQSPCADESIKNLGSRCPGLFLQLQSRIPVLEHCPKFVVQDFHLHLQQQMRAPCRQNRPPDPPVPKPSPQGTPAALPSPSLRGMSRRR
jgi:hypothetical protein